MRAEAVIRPPRCASSSHNSRWIEAVETRSVRPMTNGSFLILAVIALVSLVAWMTRYYSIAIMAALVGTGVILYDFYGGSQQSPADDAAEAGGETVRTGRHGSSVEWSRLYINNAAASQPGAVLNVSTVGIMGTNVGDTEIKLDEAYFLCGVDERRLNAQIGRGGARFKIRDVGPLPPGALFFVVSDPLGPVDAGLNPSEFLKTCATVSLVA
jgi:hypothetical protein